MRSSAEVPEGRGTTEAAGSAASADLSGDGGDDGGVRESVVVAVEEGPGPKPEAEPGSGSEPGARVSSSDQPAPLPPFALRPVLAVVGTLGAILTALSGRYGFHRDELYFVAAGHHLDWGYDDQPPLTPLLARVSTELFGETPQGLRVVATLAGMLIVVLGALIARELGGGAREQTFAAVCTAGAGLVLAIGHMVTTVTFDVPMWLLVTWIVMRLLRTGDRRWWPALGVAVGVAGQNKDLIVLLVGSLLLGVLLAGPREVLRTWWLLGASVIALLIVLPNVWWQASHGWPQLTVARGISEADGAMNRTMFVPQQLLFLSPLLVPVWIAGFVRLWRDPAVRWARAVVVAYGVTCVVVFAVGGKAYYALSLLLVVTAAGCGPVLAWCGAWRSRRGKRVLALATAMITANAVLALPLLPPQHLDIPNVVNIEQGDQIGWPVLARTVADGWALIPPEQRPQAVLFAFNYGEASALALYGPGLGLPYPYSGHVGFYSWNRPPADATGPVLVLVKKSKADEQRTYFRDCRQVGRVDNGYGLANEEQHAAVLLCGGPVEPWSTLWPKLRKYY
ncbi:glycosyltransferase family 39 protein [Yinghuangia soli]|uniref:Glycosyltransferase family 39 protein n=1 Tax=Yinghuangia soli TaxID=2908204 RepID=A0AA41Q1Z5_9ACTN|nr:glycosyltransferase family 39 protein [Yinghuangia soli]MCF2528969.1 glycosyltransferase family 39 protein [Yinghuangia soli]